MGLMRTPKPRATPDLAFPSGTAQGTVVLNSRRNSAAELGPYAAAFHRAGLSLAQQLADAHGYRDTDAGPIVYLYRQALELYLKGVIASGRRLLYLADQPLPINPRALLDHRLTPLIPAITAVFSVAGWEWSSEVPPFASEGDLRSYLESLETIDPMSFSFRYPTDKQGKASLPHHFRFNVLEFVESITPLLELLDAALTGLDELFQERAAVAFEHGGRS
jgi:hypothetical protein